MSQPALEALLAALTAVPPYDDPLAPLYAALAAERPLTLRHIRAHGQLLHACAAQADDQTETIDGICEACYLIPPTPSTTLPLGF